MTSKIDASDPRVRWAVWVSNAGWFVVLGSVILRVRVGRTGPDATVAALVTIVGVCVVVLADARIAAITRSAHKAIGVPLGLLVAFSAATGRSDAFDPPVWLTGIGIGLLVLTIGVATPFAIYIVNKVQDERERKILMSAMSFAFMLTMAVVLTFVLLEEYTTVEAPSLTWILFAAAGSWFGSYFVLRERM